MPLYVYECPNCGERFEYILSYGASDVMKCPNCSHIGSRAITAANFTVGWRLTEASHERFSKDEWERDA